MSARLTRPLPIEPIRFGKVADLYDHYVRVDFDIDFFLNEAKKAGGKVLELTSGTGRVSIPLIRAGIDLTCVDYSREMLAVLQWKLKRNGLTCNVVEMDITQLSLGEKFNLILIPFNSFSEIIEPRKHKWAIERIHSHLAHAGRFICTLQNPRIRTQALDGKKRLVGRFPIDTGAVLVVNSVLTYDPITQIARGVQRFEVYDKTEHLLFGRNLDIAFYLFNKKEFEELASAAGFRIDAVYGDYDYSPFDEDRSPSMIWILGRD